MCSNSQRSALDTMRSDVNQKITKLEADTHNLCLNLINLQKNRGKLTNETVALTRDPEDPTTGSNHTEEAINFKPDCIRVLLDPKHVQNDCCTICTCSECEETREGLDDIELKDIEEALRKTISAEEIERPNCCCMCSANSTASPQCGKWNFCSNCSIDGRCCVDCCDISECPINNYKGFDECIRTVPDIKRRCRGGMDRTGSKIRSAGSSHGEAKTRRKKNVCEGCECDLCDVRNFEGEPPPCVTTCGKSSERLCDCDDENVNDGLVISSGDAPAKLRQICKVEKLREVLEQLKNRNHALRKMLNDCECLSKSDVNSLAPEKSKSAVKKINEKSSGVRNSIAESTSGLITTVKVLQNKCRTKDGMILTLAEAVKKIATPEQTERILEKLKNPCTDDSPIRDLDRSELWNYLHTENSPKHERRHDRASRENVRDADNGEDYEIEGSSKCGCATYTEVLPPRELKIVGRIGSDTLVITWKPPKFGSVDAYEVFVDEQLVARLRTPLRRTETVLRGLDLTNPRLIEILATDPTGLVSPPIEKLFDPVRFDRSIAR